MRVIMKQKENWDIPAEFKRHMHSVARSLRRNETPAEALLWQAIRNRKLDGRKFRRQVPIGAFVVDFYCAAERLVVEVDGPVHESQQEADQIRQESIVALGIRFVRLENEEIESHLAEALDRIRIAFGD